MQAASLSTIGQQGAQNPGGTNAFNDVDLQDFISLLVTELSNQDPLSPMDNSEIVQQISQILEIESNQRLSDTLESVLLGQSLATASGMIGKTIRALSDEAEAVSGPVDRVSFEEGVASVHVGEHKIALKNIAEILP